MKSHLIIIYLVTLVLLGSTALWGINPPVNHNTPIGISSGGPPLDPCRPEWKWLGMANGTGNFLIKLGDDDFSQGAIFVQQPSYRSSQAFCDEPVCLYIMEELPDGSFTEPISMCWEAEPTMLYIHNELQKEFRTNDQVQELLRQGQVFFDAQQVQSSDFLLLLDAHANIFQRKNLSETTLDQAHALFESVFNASQVDWILGVLAYDITGSEQTTYSGILRTLEVLVERDLFNRAQTIETLDLLDRMLERDQFKGLANHYHNIFSGLGQRLANLTSEDSPLAFSGNLLQAETFVPGQSTLTVANFGVEVSTTQPHKLGQTLVLIGFTKNFFPSPELEPDHLLYALWYGTEAGNTMVPLGGNASLTLEYPAPSVEERKEWRTSSVDGSTSTWNLLERHGEAASLPSQSTLPLIQGQPLSWGFVSLQREWVGAFSDQWRENANWSPAYAPGARQYAVFGLKAEGNCTPHQGLEVRQVLLKPGFKFKVSNY